MLEMKISLTESGEEVGVHGIHLWEAERLLPAKKEPFNGFVREKLDDQCFFMNKD